MNIGTSLQHFAQKLPGNNAAQSRVGDILTGGVARAVNRNNWRIPSVHGDQTSIDDLAAVGTGNSSKYRTAARTAGIGFGSWGAGELSGSPYLTKGIMGARNLFGGQGGQSSQGVPSSNIEGGGNDMGGGTIWSGLNVGGFPQTQGTRDIAGTSKGTTPLLYDAAQQVAGRGRMGDSNLLHVSDGELADLNSTGKLTQNPDTGLPEAFSLGGFGGGIGSFLGNNSGPLGQIGGGLFGMGLGNQYQGGINSSTNRAVSIGAPLENQQRQQYQQQLQQMLSDPSGFMNTDPFIQSSKKALGDQYQANFAKSGNLPFEGIQSSAALQQMMSQAYNDRIKQLSTLGGFDQGPGYGGMLAQTGGNLGAQIGNNNRTGGMNQLFGGLGGLMGGQGSGMGGLFSGIGNLFGGQGNQLSYGNDPFGSGGDWGQLFNGVGGS